MAIIKRVIMPLGKVRREIIYVSGAVNDEVITPHMHKIFTVGIVPVNRGLSSYINDTSITIDSSGGRNVLTIRDPDSTGSTIMEIDVIGQ